MPTNAMPTIEVPTNDGPVLITGAAGLLGYWLLQTAPPDTELAVLTHQRPVASAPTVLSVQADLRDASSTESALDHVRPSLVIHAAYAKDRASIVDATTNIAAAAGALSVPVMFTSTDAVFRGDGIARDETSPPDPVWDYGRWKAEAEQIVIAQAPANSVVRLPLLMSIDPDDPTVAKIRNAAGSGEVTHWYADEIRKPALASEVAAAMWRIGALGADERAGFWHLTGAHSMSRFELASWAVGQLNVPASTIESVPQPEGSVRPPHLNLRAARARSQVDWDPTALR